MRTWLEKKVLNITGNAQQRGAQVGGITHESYVGLFAVKREKKER